jgi:hypothetical protein
VRDRVGAGDRPHVDQRAQRHHVGGLTVLRSVLFGLAPHVEAADVGRRRPEARLGLELDAIDPAEGVEVVHVEGAEEDLQGGEDVGDRDAERPRLRAIDLGIELRHPRSKPREHAGKLGPLARRVHDLPRDRVDVIERAAGDALHLELESAAGADAADRRRREDHDGRLLDRAQLRAQAPDDGVGLELGLLPLRPRLESRENRRHVRPVDP